ncbi:hypothetical protein KC318_g15074, partial [Hortaea werneckii]
AMKLSGHASQDAVYGTAIAFAILAGLSVVARIITRIFIVKRAGVDDAFAVVGFVFSIVMTIGICKQALYGMGLHWQSLPKTWLSPALAWYWAFMWNYYAALVFTKLSILCQYLRIFPHSWFRKTCWFLIAFITVWGLWAFFSAIFMCNPISAFWDLNIFAWDQPQCLDRATVWYFNGAINFVTDCIIAAMPLPLIHSLELPRRQKMILTVIFGAGYVVCVISVLRLIYVYPISTATDVTWESPLAAIWSAVETNTGIICCSAPTLKGCIAKYFPKLLNSIRSQPVDSENSMGMEKFGISGNSSQSYRCHVVAELPAAKTKKPEVHTTVLKWMPSRKTESRKPISMCYGGADSRDSSMEVFEITDKCPSPEPEIEVSRSVHQTSEDVSRPAHQFSEMAQDQYDDFQRL